MNDGRAPSSMEPPDRSPWRAGDELATVLTRLAAEPHPHPVLVLPHAVQWRVVDIADEPWVADLVLARPEFSARVKLAVAPHAHLRTRVEWMSTDPDLAAGDFLLESMRIAQHPRSKWTAVHLVGNRPSLARVVLELGLEPLYPAAARHTMELEEHAALFDALDGCSDPIIRERATDVFTSRTDVSWVLRHRASREFVGPSRIGRVNDVGEISESWNTIVFAEANDPGAAVERLPEPVCRLRRAGSRILTWPASLPASVRQPAEATARTILAARYAEDLSASATSVEAAPPTLATLVSRGDLAEVLAGEQAPSRRPQPSIRPPSQQPTPEPPSQEPNREQPTSEARTWRAKPTGEVFEVDH